jgi:5'(3')-deoxyribonucleotidase
MPKNASNKPIIAVDVDDVLTDSAQAIVHFSNQKWRTNLTLEDYDEHWGDMWKADNAEWYKRADQIFAAKILQGQPLNRAVEVLTGLSGAYELVITTSRVRPIAEDTRQWLEENFAKLFGKVHCAGIWEEDSPHMDKAKATKAHLLQAVGASYLIDDQPKHCLAAAELGITALLFGDYPWNRNDVLPKGVTRVKDWEEVEEYFRGRRD